MPPGRWASASSFALPGSWQKQRVEFGPGAPGTACGAVGHLERAASSCHRPARARRTCRGTDRELMPPMLW